MDYIARLLASPNTDILAFDFIPSNRSGSSVVPTYQRTSKVGLENDGLSLSDFGDAGVILDDQAKKEYRERLREIEADLAEAKDNNDSSRTEELHREKEALIHELKAAVGLGGRDRKASSAAERVRTSVSRNIRRSIENIREHDPKLAQFLDNSIKTGITCSYCPDHEIAWIL
jgi:hypothetical protein